jgi:hypothetical protein
MGGLADLRQGASGRVTRYPYHTVSLSHGIPIGIAEGVTFTLTPGGPTVCSPIFSRISKVSTDPTDNSLCGHGPTTTWFIGVSRDEPCNEIPTYGMIIDRPCRNCRSLVSIGVEISRHSFSSEKRLFLNSAPTSIIARKMR